MSKFSYKSLLIIFFFLLIGIIILARFVLPKNKVSAGWWNDSWSYRKAISITNSTGSDQTNAQVKLLSNSDLSGLISAGKIQANLNDLRFTDINGNLIKYWIEDNTNNSVDVWGFVPSLSSSNASIYMYYGNPSASSTKITVGTQSYPGISCQAILKVGITADGVYYIDPDGLNPSNNYQAYCDMTYDGGGWTMMMKATRGTTFNYDANYWTTNNTLNPTDLTRNDADAKYQAFNELKVNDIMARWPDFGDIRWLKTGAWSTAVTPLVGFNSFVSWGNPQNQPDWNATYFSSQVTQCPSGPGVYGTKLTDLGGVTAGSRWGYRFNENGCGNWGSDDAGGGIGIKAGGYIGPLASTGASAGDSFGCCGAIGFNRTARVEVYGRDTTISIANITTATPTTEELSPAPIAYWKFDEGIGTTTLDSTSNSNTGTITGATWQTEDQCIFQKCLKFDGNDSVNVTDPINNNLDFGIGNFTIEFWINYQGITTINGTPGTIIQKSISYNSNPGFFAGISTYGGDGSNYGIVFSTTNGAWGTGNIEHTGSYKPNTWYHVTGVRNGNTFTIYQNGRYGISTSKAGINVDVSNSQNILIGGGAWGFVNAQIDEVKIYPYARTAAQIKLDYNSRGTKKGSSVNLGIKSNTAPSLKSKLVGYWKFDEGNGTTAYDSINSKGYSIDNAISWKNDDCRLGKCIYGTGATLTNNVVSNFDYNIMKNSYENSNWTLSAWIKPNGNQSGNERVIIGRSGCHSGLMVNVNSFMFQLFNGGCSGTTNIIYTPPNMTDWYYLSAVYNQRNMYLYVNGKLVGTNTMPDNIFPHSNNLFIGGVGFWAFKGWIDEVKIYNSALTADEIKQDYNAGSAIQMGATSQTIGGTTTSLEYCIPGDTSPCSPPVAEWKMDEGVGTSTVDTSGNNKTLTTFTGSPSWKSGKIGGAIKFNGGTDKIGSTSTTAINRAAGTMSMWIKATSFTGSTPTLYDTNGYYWLHFNSNSGTLLWNGGNSTALAGPTLSTEQWYFITITWGNTERKIYINGIYQVGDTTTPSNDPSNDMYIGNNAGSIYPFQGTIDQIRIYNYARTPAQIAYDYNKGGPIGWWKFDECQGNIAYDWSGIGNTGTIVIGASGTQNSLGTCQVGTSAAWTNGAVGKLNSSLNFDGVDDYINMGDPANGSLDFGINDFSTSAWIKTSSNQQGVIAGKYNGYPLFYSRLNADGKIESRIGFDGSTNYTSTNGTTVNNNIWHQIIVVYKRNGNMTRYLDGNIYGTPLDISTSSSLSINTNNNLTVGAGSGPSQLFQGQIDDVRIYNYALTPAQVKTLYNGGAVSFN